jgi:hypothetical protein
MAKKISVSIDLKDLNKLVALSKQAKGQIKSTASSGTKDFERLKNAIDPAYRAQKMFSDQLKVLNAQRSKMGDDQYNKYLKMIQINAKQAGISINQFGQIASVNTRKMKRFGAVGMQQVGYQVQDFAVQVQSGTSAMVALGQQGSQLLGIFGPAGAIAGAILAVGTGLAGAVIAARKAAAEANDVFADFDKQLKQAGETAKAVTQDLAVLRGGFQDVTEMVLDQAVKRAEEALKKAEDMPQTKKGDRAGAIVKRRQDAIKAAKEELRLAKEKLDTFIEERKEKAKILNINKLTIVKEKKRVEDTAELLRLKYRNERLAKEELRDQELFLQGLETQHMEQGVINGLKGRELEVAKQFVETYKFKLSLEKRGVEYGSEHYQNIMEQFKAIQSYKLAAYDRKEAEKAIAEEQKKQLERFKELQREAKRLNAIQTDSEKLGASIANSFESAMMSMVDGTMSVKDAFKSMAAAIIKDLYRIYVVKKITGMITSAFEGGDAALSGPQHGGGRANGGPVQGGRSYTVGERGPEIFTPAMSGTITPNSGGGGGATTIVQNINVSTGVQQTVRAEIRQMMPQIADSAKGAVLDAKRRGGSYGRAMA